MLLRMTAEDAGWIPGEEKKVLEEIIKELTAWSNESDLQKQARNLKDFSRSAAFASAHNSSSRFRLAPMRPCGCEPFFIIRAVCLGAAIASQRYTLCLSKDAPAVISCVLL